MQLYRLGGRGGEQRAHVLRFTRADVFVACCLGWRDRDGWRTRRLQHARIGPAPVCTLLAALVDLICALGSQRSRFHLLFTVKSPLALVKYT